MPSPADFQQAFGAMLADPTRLPADPALVRALAVHRNTAMKAATDALAANYPVVATLVGAEPFAAAAATFVRQAPPTEPRLCLYGGGFAEFLAGYAPFAALDYLADVATVERMVVTALFAADATPLDAAALAAGIDPDAPLAMHPAARIARLASPGATIWHAHLPGAPADALERLAWRAETVLVTRPGEAIMVAALDPAATAFVDAVIAGATLGEAATAAMPHGDIAAAFAILLGAGALIAG